MALQSCDEWCHRPNESPTWQENYFFLGWDPVSLSGFLFHLTYRARSGTVLVHALVSAGGATVSTKSLHPAPDALTAPGLVAEVVDPYRHWNLSWAGTGKRAGPEDLWLTEEGGDEPFGFNISLETSMDPLDFRATLRSVGFPEDALSDHYESGSRFSGTITVAGETRPVSGLSVRDHSWGPRDFTGFTGYWFPMVFDGADEMCAGTSLFREGKWTGFLLRGGKGEPTVSFDPWVRIDGLPEPAGYTRGQVLDRHSGELFTFTNELTVPARHPDIGTDHVLSDMLATVHTSDRSGFGVLEMNRRWPAIPPLAGHGAR